MGNTETRETVNGRELPNAQTKYQVHKRNLNVNLSEEDYLPMSLSMRRALVDGRRFQHVVPGKEITADVKTNKRQKLQGNMTLRNVKTTDKNGSLVNVLNDVEETEQLGQVDKEEVFENKHEVQPSVEPTVQIVGDRKLSDSNYDKLIKSRFMLDMEEKLRKSKFELLSLSSKSWKEFSYIKNELKSPDRKTISVGTKVDKDFKDHTQRYSCQNSVNELKTASIKDDNFQEYDVKHLLRDNCKCELCVLSYLTDINPHMSSSLETTKGGESDNSLQEMLRISGTNKNNKRQDSWISIAESAGSSFKVDSTNRRIREQFLNNSNSFSSNMPKNNCSLDEIKRCNELNRTEVFENNCASELKRNPGIRTSSLEAKVYPENEHHTDTVTNMSSQFIEKHNVEKKKSQILVEKCIYKMEQNGSKINEMDSGRMMWIGLPVLEQEKDVLPVSETDEGGQDTSRFLVENSAHLNDTQKVVFQGKCSPKNHNHLKPKKSSSIQFETSPSTSLATIMSYHRVRQIFQTIIEKNQPRRRKMRNIAEFRKMEELGLGKVHNRRWYPGADKTLSIWSGLHASLSGVQAQFRKYHKPV